MPPIQAPPQGLGVDAVRSLVGGGAMWRLGPAEFAEHLSGGRYVRAKHLDIISRAVVDLVEGRLLDDDGQVCRGLAISAPPRNGKSETISKWTPAWYASMYQAQTILCSYEALFAAEWGGKARDILAEHQTEVGVAFTNSQPSRDHWELVDGGGMRTAGAGGAITGKGASLLIIDDPHKNWQEAKSLTIRNQIWDWWTSTAFTRIEPRVGRKIDPKTGQLELIPGVVVLMATRWDEDDLTGRVLSKSAQDEFGIRWKLLDFPILIETEEQERNDLLGRKMGEALWPVRFPTETVLTIKGTTDLQVWNALYQGRPADQVAAGDVYKVAFTRRDNVAGQEFDPRLELRVACDFNFGKMSWLLCQHTESKQGDVRILEELVGRGIDVPDHATHLADVLNRRYAPFIAQRGNLRGNLWLYGDASGSNRSANSRRSCWESMRAVLNLKAPFFNLHFKVPRANPGVVDRTAAVRALLRSASGEHRLFIDPKCVELIADFDFVKWVRNTDGRVIYEIDKSDAERTHISDALGYYVMQEFSMHRVGRPQAGRGMAQ